MVTTTMLVRLTRLTNMFTPYQVLQGYLMIDVDCQAVPQRLRFTDAWIAIPIHVRTGLGLGWVQPLLLDPSAVALTSHTVIAMYLFERIHGHAS